MSKSDYAYKVAETIEKILNDAYICHELYSVDTTGIVGNVGILIPWGDWKHDHLRADYLVPYTCTHVVVTEEDGSDCYSAVHFYEY